MKHVTQICAVALLTGSAGLAEVPVEFDASGNLIVKDQIRTFVTTTATERIFVPMGSTHKYQQRPDEQERVFEFSKRDEKHHEAGAKDAAAFTSKSTGERRYSLPLIVLAPAPISSDVVTPLPAAKTSPRVVAEPAPPIEPRVHHGRVAGAHPLKLEDILRIQPVSFDTITFETGSSRLRPAAYKQLDHIAAALARDPDLKIKIVGHTDHVGTQEDNQQLSEQRAAAVVRALTQRYGVNPARLESAGRGETNPVDTNDTAEGRARNRRVEFMARP